MSTHTPLHRRLLALGSAVAAFALAPAPAAEAGTYDVYTCKSPSGAAAPIGDAHGGWRTIGDDGAALQLMNGCPSGGPLTAAINRRNDVGYGGWVAWQFRAPAGTRMTAYDLSWDGWTAGDRFFAGHAYVQRGDGQVVASEHALHREFGPHSVRQDGLDLDHLNVAASCVSNPTCVAGPASSWVAYSRIWSARMTLRDDTKPQARATGGSLARDATWEGAETIALSAEDQGAGVYRAVLWVDDVAVESTVLDTFGGRCADADPGHPDRQFVHPKPCAASTDGAFTVNTKRLAEGTHDIRVTVEDAAGNHGLAYGPETKLVDNVKPPALKQVPVISGTAADGRTLHGAPAVFDAGEGPVPTVTRQWQRCHSVELRCVDVAGATQATYDLGAGDVGKRLRVVETARNSEGVTPAPSEPTRIVTRSDGSLPEDGNGLDDDGDGQTDEPGERRPVTTADNGKDDDCDGQVDEAGEQHVVGPCNNGRDDDGDGQVDEAGETAGSGGAGGTTGTSGVPGASGATGAAGPAGAAGTNGRDGGSASSTTTNTSTSTSTTVANSTTTVNGTGASRSARLQVSFRGIRGRTATLAYGKGAVVAGRLVDGTGRPIGGAAVTVSETSAVRGTAAKAGPTATTGADGRFTYRAARRGSSRTIRFAYAYERGGAAVAQAALTVRVRAAASLAVTLRGVDVTYRGRVVSGPVPSSGKLVIVQGRAKGGTWQTFASPRTNRRGVFTGRYRLKVRNPGRKLQFRARVVTESGYAYLEGTSRTVTRTVR